MEESPVAARSHEVTALLCAWRRGDAGALGRLVPLVHDELHRRARNYMRGERPNHTLRPTALVSEAYLRLIDVRGLDWKDRAHFLAMAARQMRRVLIDSARARGYQKRGGGVPNVTFDESDGSGTTLATREGAIIGTPAYMSPEQTRGADVDKRSDVWSFGCVLYEMLTGRRAFGGETASDAMAAVLEREPYHEPRPVHSGARVSPGAPARSGAEFQEQSHVHRTIAGWGIRPVRSLARQRARPPPIFGASMTWRPRGFETRRGRRIHSSRRTADGWASSTHHARARG